MAHNREFVDKQITFLQWATLPVVKMLHVSLAKNKLPE